MTEKKLNRTVCEFPMQSKLGQLKLATNAKSNVLQAYKQHHSQQQHHAANTIRKVVIIIIGYYLTHHEILLDYLYINIYCISIKTSQTLLNQSYGGGGESRDLLTSAATAEDMESMLLESMVSYRDVPVMKDLLATQKRIRAILDEWVSYCRTSLNIMSPAMYILPELSSRGHRRPVGERLMRLSLLESPLDRTKSKSAECLRVPLDLRHKPNNNNNRGVIIDNDDDLRSRSKSALIGT